MKTVTIQEDFFRQIKQKLPSHLSMADEIATLLNISQDSAYRRIRGEKPLTIDEIQLLQEGVRQLDLTVDELTLQKWIEYLALLQKWNAIHNLIAEADLQQVIIRHLLDSLTLAPFIKGPRVIDIGTGAGFPGLPLAILFPQYEWVLLDARKKRCEFLQHVVHQLGLRQVEIKQQRAEQFIPEKLFDQVLARAVGSASQMINYSAHLLAPTGTIWLMKGQHPQQEITELDEQTWKSNIFQVKVPFLAELRHLLALHR